MARVGELERQVLDILWSRSEPTSVRDVMLEVSRTRPLAYTTVLTIMQRLARKGLLERVLVGRAHLYKPTSSRDALVAQRMTEALHTSEDVRLALLHLVERLTSDEAAELRRILEQVEAVEPAAEQGGAAGGDAG